LLLGVEAIGRLVEGLRNAFPLAPDAEITVEVNPAADLPFPALRAAGVTRVSVGVQALQDTHLTYLGRAHDASLALRTVERAAAAGLAVSADLMYGFAGLSAKELADSARRLIDAGARHLSAYSLEAPAAEHTTDHAKPTPTETGKEERQWEALVDFLDSLGFRPYEVSNFAPRGFESRHNVNYWAGGAYLGLGPGAHGFLTGGSAFGRRYWNAPGLTAWAAALEESRLPPGGTETLTRDEALLEALFLAFRRQTPFSPAALAKRFGIDETRFAPLLAELCLCGDLTAGTGDGFTPTRSGLRRADGLALWIHDRLSASS
jgi:oxygen-independent coproporphyrinogen-3 oxidase